MGGLVGQGIRVFMLVRVVKVVRAFMVIRLIRVASAAENRISELNDS